MRLFAKLFCLTLAFSLLFATRSQAQVTEQGNGCQATYTTLNGNVTFSVIPASPIQLSFFPLSLLGLGTTSTSRATALRSIGVQITNTGDGPRSFNVEADVQLGGVSLLERIYAFQLDVEVGTFFIGIDAILNFNSAPGINVPFT